MNLETLRQHYKPQILALAERYDADNIRIFGSVARGEASVDSDVDILVHLKPEADLYDLGGLYTQLEELLECKVDVVPDESLHWYIKDRVLNEAVLL